MLIANPSAFNQLRSPPLSRLVFHLVFFQLETAAAIEPKIEKKEEKKKRGKGGDARKKSGGG